MDKKKGERILLLEAKLADAKEAQKTHSPKREPTKALTFDKSINTEK